MPGEGMEAFPRTSPYASLHLHPLSFSLVYNRPVNISKCFLEFYVLL